MRTKAGLTATLGRRLAGTGPAAPGGPSLRRRRAEPLRHRMRFVLAIGLFCAVYGLICGRLFELGAHSGPHPDDRPGASTSALPRPDLVDRNGEVLATDIRSASLFAEPLQIVDREAAATKLSAVLPDLDPATVRARLDSGATFAWLKHEVTPRQERAIAALGIPGIGLRTDQRRFYPGGRSASQVTGYVDAVNHGVAGMERYIDATRHLASTADDVATGALEPVQLSLDLRVQHIVRDELGAAMERYRAVSAGGLILDVETGEVVAMTSLPDYDSNNPMTVGWSDQANRITDGAAEMGSNVAALTAAMALEAGAADLSTALEAPLSRTFGGLAGLASPEVGRPPARMPPQLRDRGGIESSTTSFAQEAETTPLQTAASAAALMNGGYYLQPTFLPRSRREARARRVPVISEDTAEAVRVLFRQNADVGTGFGASYDLGGRAGVAEKTMRGRYVSGKRMVAYLGAFPMSRPRYVVLVALDEPERVESGPAAGRIVGSTTAAIVRRAAALLGVRPHPGHEGPALLVAY